MNIYIMHKAKIYRSNDNEVYTWAAAFGTRDDAENAIRDEIASDIDADMDGSEDCDEDEREEVIENCTEAAFAEGDEWGQHDAILNYGDFTAYYDITETSIKEVAE